MTITRDAPRSRKAVSRLVNVAPGSMLLFALCLFCLTNSGFDTSEGIFHYQVAEQFVQTGQIGFDHPLEGIFTTSPNGRTYASHEFGNTLLMIPTAAMNRALGQVLASRGVSPERVERSQQFILSFQACLYTALTVFYLYLILIDEFALTGRQAFAGCAFLATCTYIWTYSRNLFDGVLCGLLLIAALRYLLRFRRIGKTADALLAFGLLGFAVTTRVSMVIPAATALAYVALFCTGRKPRGLAAAVIALAPFAAWQLYYNDLRTGNPFVSPVQSKQYAATNSLDGNLGTGLLGLLLSPGKSIFIYAPMLVLSVAVFPAFWRKYRPAAVFILMVGVGWLVLHAKIRNWYGMWGWGPRHFVTILPVVAIPSLVFCPIVWRSRCGRVAIAATAAAGFGLAAMSLVGNWHYRMELRALDGTLGDDFIWSISRGQAIDMVAGAIANARVMTGTGDPASVPLASDLNNYASNRVNMWWFTLPRAGIPPSAPVLGALVLLTGLVITATRLTRPARGISLPRNGSMIRNLAILTDFPEEGWRSMDLCGEMLLDHLPRHGRFGVDAVRLCPPFRRVATRLPALGGGRAAFNSDRLLNRFILFPRQARLAVHRFDLFHIADHSYGQLVHVLPAGRTGVFCHDLDAFRCLFDRSSRRRRPWLRAMSARILSGLRKAAVVFHSTNAVADELRREELIDPERLVHAPMGVAPEFAPEMTEPTVTMPWLADLEGQAWLLHVGSTVARKRIDVLLEVVAAVRETVPGMRLVKVGGEWSADHRARIGRLGIAGAITHVTGLSRPQLAEVYRRAPIVLVPSEAEGFGLPVIEALACGAVVVASDIPALREAGGPAAVFVPVGDVSAWSTAVMTLLTGAAAAPPRSDRLEWAGRFTWKAHAEIVAETYHRLLHSL